LEVNLNGYNLNFTGKSFGIQNLEVPEFRSIFYIENRRRNFGTLKNVWISEVSGF
jgi:hypothetical protein